MIENATSANGLKELKPEKVASLMTKVDKKLGPDSIGVLTYVPDNLPEVDVDDDATRRWQRGFVRERRRGCRATH